MIRVLLVACILALGTPFLARFWVHMTARGRVYADVANVPKCRVALVLGCKVTSKGILCSLLRDRVDTAIALYKAGTVEKLLMSGDNSVIDYDEPTAMAAYAIKHGVDPKDVSMDFAGRRTYDSIYRAKHIFGLDSLVVVSQGFHLERALFLCDRIDVDACGVAADAYAESNGRYVQPSVQSKIREIPACLSAVLDAYFLHPTPIMGKKETI